MTARLCRTALHVATLLAVALGATPAAAQQATPNQLWYQVAVGAGSARFTCDPCAPGRDGGPAVRAAAGAWARPGLRVGITAGAWTHERGDLRESVRHAGLTAALDVRPGGPLHLIAGLGWVGWRSDPFAYDAADLSVGAGWNVPLVGRWALSNTAMLHSASFGTLRNDDDTAVRGVSLSLARFEIGLIRR